MEKKTIKSQKGGETDMLDILRKYFRTGTHRREAGQPTPIWVKPREAGESWYVA